MLTVCKRDVFLKKKIWLYPVLKQTFKLHEKNGQMFASAPLPLDDCSSASRQLDVVSVHLFYLFTALYGTVTSEFGNL